MKNQKVEGITSLLNVILLLVQVILSIIILYKIDSLSSASTVDSLSRVFEYVEGISADDDPSKGTPGAPVTIVGFADYQCSHCAQAAEYVKQILTELYPSQVIYVHKDFPLPHHGWALKAAQAAHCAGDQGRYWEMHDSLFANHSSPSVNFGKLAASLGLDVQIFNDCLNSEKYGEEVQHDIMEGLRYGVEATPTFFINGRKVTGSSLELLLAAVEQALGKGG